MRLCLFVLALSITATSQDTFKPNGDPFKNFEKPTSFDSACAAQTGNAKPKTGSFAQDAVKNNFNATLPPKDITIAELATLQQDVATHQGFPWGRGSEPKTRDTFHKMKDGFQEGQAVRLTAYILKGKAADTDSGESVNCGFGTQTGKATNVVSAQKAAQFNDIHIALVADKGETSECQSVTAEITPHFRPAAWTVTLFKTTDKGKLVRLTGQLMFDASHTVCAGSVAGNGQPARQSGWEVHPVYQVEVCDKDDGKGKCTGSWKKI